MSSTLFYTAKLDEPTPGDLQNLENELDVTLVAMDSNSAQVPAQLSEAQLQRIQALEVKAGMVLLAYT